MSDTAERCHQGKDFSLVIPLRGVTGLRALRASCRTLEVIYSFLGAERCHQGNVNQRPPDTVLSFKLRAAATDTTF